MTGPLLADPHRIGKRLLPPMDDRFSARRGTYRVIYRIDDKARVVTVVDVARRRDVYRTCARRAPRNSTRRWRRPTRRRRWPRRASS
ncbi:MAG: type II toxin-antitoxin system RelE family toxin [Polyangiaceae bacterium]